MAGGGDDQHRLAGVGVGAKEKRPVGRGIGDVQSRALREGDLIGQGIDLLGVAQRKLGVGTADRACSVDAIAGPKASNLGADGGDDAGCVPARTA